MYPSEIAWFIDNFERSGCDVLIECGRQDGVSTEVFAEFFRGSGTALISIDFDEDPLRARRARERVRGYDIELVSGDVHEEVPRILRRCAGRKVAVLQDGPKGWEGLATLLAAAVSDEVLMIAQHNLHQGHVTRAVFQTLSLHPTFVEYAEGHDRFEPLIAAEREALRTKNPNRPLDHTSLGVMLTDPVQKRLIEESFRVLKSEYGPWNPARVVSAWKRDDFGYVGRLRKRSRFTPARFKAR
jgi:hypothetical protein